VDTSGAVAKALQFCASSAKAGIAGCKNKGGTTAQITQCETGVSSREQTCEKRANAIATNGSPGKNFGQQGDNSISGNNTNSLDAAASAASAAAAAQASAANAQPKPVHFGIPATPIQQHQ